MSDYLQLKTSVDSWLARDDVALTGSDWPTVMQMVESRLARDLRLVGNEATVTLTFTGRSQSLPADFLEQRDPFIDDNFRRFEYKTPKAIRQSREWSDGRVAQSYTLEGFVDTVAADDRVQMTIAAPASVSDPVDVEIRYWRRYPALLADLDTNWLLNNHFDIYLYAALLEAAIYIQETELAQGYGTLYNDAKTEQNKLENRKRYGATPKQAYSSPRTIV